MGKYPKTLSAFDLNEWFNSEDENPIIIDVREDSELEIACFPKKFLHLPISKVSAEYVKTKISDLKDKKFVVLCHAGIRSYNFGEWSLENNLVNEIWNLEEGIDGWSKYIDQTIPRY
ncbi:MAG: rhodanese [Prochlorococcus sp. MED105]|nr:rhodanese [Prochlorococcus sp. MED105]